MLGSHKTNTMTIKRILLCLSSLIMANGFAYIPSAQAETTENHSTDNDNDLALKLQNPVANLISVPIQNNWDFGAGSTNAMHYTVNVQPVIPFSINDDWNLITRTILPISHLEPSVAGGKDVNGLGDITQSFFLSPKAPVGGWIMGAGPAFLYPSASDNALGSQKWGAGPTAVFLKQEDGWTYGALANHIWSFAGSAYRTDVSSTFLQPFIAYTTKMHTTLGLNTESTYNWESNQWNVPLNLQLSQVLKLGSQPVQFTLGGRYYADKPAGGADWGLRFVVTLIFPK